MLYGSIGYDSRIISGSRGLSRDHDLGALDDREYLGADGQAQAFGARARDDGDEFLVADLDADLGHDAVGDDGDDATAEAIAGADFEGAVGGGGGGRVRGTRAPRGEQRAPREEPLPAEAHGGEFTRAREELHALDVQVEELGGFVGGDEVVHARNSTARRAGWGEGGGVREARWMIARVLRTASCPVGGAV